jgi:hypothetical protein
VRTKDGLRRLLRYAVLGPAVAVTLLAAQPAGAFAASTSQGPPPRHATSAFVGQKASGPATVTSPNVLIGCVYTGNKPFRLTTSSYTLYAQGWIVSCSSPAPNECRLQVHIWQNGPYGWFELPGGNAGSWGPCTVGKRLQAKYSCSPSSSHQYQTEVTLTVLVGSRSNATSIFITPYDSFNCD